MWDHKKSLLLSKILTVLLAVGVAAVMLYGPWLVEWVIMISRTAQGGLFWHFIITLYTGGVVALALLACLFLLLRNLSRGAVFTHANVRLLRALSWCCFIGAAVAAASGLYYLPWLMVTLVAGFVGIIVRVVKNILAEAIALKEENDLTV